MKVIQAFATIFSVLAFLTLGSLLLIVALRLLSLEDAVLRIQEMYTDPWRSIQTGMVGLLFIFVGLTFAKMLIKRGRQAEAVIFQGESGPVVVSTTAIEDVVKRILKRFPLVKEWKTKILIDNRDVEIKLRLILWSGGDVPALLTSVQQEVKDRLKKVLSPDGKLEIHCDVSRIEESHLEMEEGTVTV
ncbi:MAG: alkaline shock response membrane anchor protein AmaP [Candidatus Omnitrophica bacterium]|nr:alkaline shock response membrane anchor protein AmaP [Candidatus Omnitrophota bacterium]